MLAERKEMAAGDPTLLSDVPSRIGYRTLNLSKKAAEPVTINDNIEVYSTKFRGRSVKLAAHLPEGFIHIVTKIRQ